jgi:branched-chain amino acid transport system substrate-binding protein
MHRSKQGTLAFLGASVAVMVALVLPTASGAAGSSPGVTAKTITIGLVIDETGGLASTFGDGVGAAQARVAYQNAHGGVDGRKLKLVVADDQSNPSEVQTAAQDLVETKGVFGVVADTAFTFGGSSYLTKQGIPVTGDDIDGPEWGTAPNMFSYGEPTFTIYPGNKSYNYETVSKFMKSIGVTKVAVLGYSIPSSVLSDNQTIAMDTALGLKSCYVNNSVPIASVDFTAIALQIKQAGCNGVLATFIAASNVALAQALKNDGLNQIKQFYYTSFAQSTLQSPGATAALDNTYGEGVIPGKATAGGRATSAFYADLKKYDSSYTGGIPDLGATTGWVGVDELIEGLKLAGPNPTRAKFIADLRKVKNYTAGGLFSPAIDFNTLTGNLPKTACASFVELKGSKFVPVPASGAPLCASRFTYTGSG